MTHGTVFVVDDEPDVRDALNLLIRSMGHQVQTFPSAAAFLAAYRPEQPGCLVLDVRLPGMSGLDLQQRLREQECAIPIVFISGHGDIPMAVRAVQAGAVDFLVKPFSDADLLDRIERALARDRQQRRQAAESADVKARLERLTPREKEVLRLLLRGAVNKMVARELDLSIRTVEIHRARILHKMGAANVPQLIRMVMRSGSEREADGAQPVPADAGHSTVSTRPAS